jgi:hypothetical protein
MGGSNNQGSSDQHGVFSQKHVFRSFKQNSALLICTPRAVLSAACTFCTLVGSRSVRRRLAAPTWLNPILPASLGQTWDPLGLPGAFHLSVMGKRGIRWVLNQSAQHRCRWRYPLVSWAVCPMQAGLFMTPSHVTAYPPCPISREKVSKLHTARCHPAWPAAMLTVSSTFWAPSMLSCAIISWRRTP